MNSLAWSCFYFGVLSGKMRSLPYKSSIVRKDATEVKTSLDSPSTLYPLGMLEIFPQSITPLFLRNTPLTINPDLFYELAFKNASTQR